MSSELTPRQLYNYIHQIQDEGNYVGIHSDGISYIYNPNSDGSWSVKPGLNIGVLPPLEEGETKDNSSVLGSVWRYESFDIFKGEKYFDTVVISKHQEMWGFFTIETAETWFCWDSADDLMRSAKKNKWCYLASSLKEYIKKSNTIPSDSMENLNDTPAEGTPEWWADRGFVAFEACQYRVPQSAQGDCGKTWPCLLLVSEIGRIDVNEEGGTVIIERPKPGYYVYTQESIERIAELIDRARRAK